jgi:TolB-like protein/Tfp pilus assembly protein PilF
MSMNADTDANLDPDRIAIIRSHLQEILASPVFEGGTRARQFLELVVEHALAGRYDELRERMIGAAMFGRPVNYDTANDAVVRVKASEVRKKLTQYYQTRKEVSPVRITLPPGSYAPKFSWEDQIVESPLPVTTESPIASEQPTAAQNSEAIRAKPLFLNRTRLVMFSVPVLLILVALGLYIANEERSKDLTGIHSIAVLPLQNLSGDPQREYFADAMTEELIAELGQLAALRVISRTSAMTYKGSKKTLPEIARELGVDAVVEGSVLPEGDRMRITAQLIDARTDRHLWAHTYDRSLKSVLTSQGEVAQAIADEIKIEVTPEAQAHLARARPLNTDAQELYLRGVQLQNQGDPRKSIGYLLDANDKDPDYPPTHVALANGYGWLGESGLLPYSEAFNKQKSEALKAIALDDTLPGGHAELAGALMNLNWDWSSPEKQFARALELNPSSAPVHSQYAFFLIRLGRLNEAIAQAKISLQLDPVSSRTYTDLAFIYYFAGQYDQALANLQKADKLNPNPPEYIYPRAIIYVEKGMYEDAISEFHKLGQQPHALGHMGNAYARMGRITEAQESISRLREHVQADGIGRYEIALVYAGLGKKDEAFQWLDQAYQARDKGLTYIKIDPCLNPLHSDTRFQDLKKLVGLP